MLKDEIESLFVRLLIGFAPLIFVIVFTVIMYLTLGGLR